MLNIREAVKEDNEELLRLEEKSPQGTGIAIVIDRDDYFYRSSLHDNGKVLIAEERQNPVIILYMRLMNMNLLLMRQILSVAVKIFLFIKVM